VGTRRVFRGGSWAIGSTRLDLASSCEPQDLLDRKICGLGVALKLRFVISP